MLQKVNRRLNEVMNHAVNLGILQYNPLINVHKLFPQHETQHRPTVPPEKLPEFLYKLSNANIHFQTRCLIEWQLLTMVRPKESVEALWSEIDLDKKVWSIPADKMKMKRDHNVPLSPQAIDILT